MFTLEEILKATAGRVLRRETRIVNNSSLVTCHSIFSGVSTDSRNIKEGEIFIALKGPRFDGHDFLNDAISKGARGIIIEESRVQSPEFGVLIRDSRLQIPDSRFSMIVVQDTLRALQDIAHYLRLRYDIPVIGVTGSNGKSTTKEIIASILSRRWKVLKSEGNINNHIGVPLTLLKLKPEHQAIVLEMAMRAQGEIKRLSEIARPTIGVITNIGPAHLETLGSLDRVAKAKAEMFETLDEEGTAILNNDDQYLKKIDLSNFKGWVVSYGFSEDADLRAAKIKHEGISSTFSIVVKTNIVDYLLPSVMLPSTAPVLGKKKEIKIEGIHLPLPGRHNIYNALAAASVAITLGFDPSTIKEGLEGFRPLPMRSEVIEIKGRKVINDTYNSNPDSMEAALQTLKHLSNRGRSIAVLGDMLELGDWKEKAHRELGSKIAKMGIGEFIAVGDLMRYAASTAQSEGMEKGNIHICSSPEEANKILKEISREGDTILIKGSRAIGMERTLKGGF
jgi:UDP-N-acetylmuramoyl-tripeptide--D-alanyl-D-alanine ligase